MLQKRFLENLNGKYTYRLISLLKKSSHSNLFWSVFSRIRTRITLNTGVFSRSVYEEIYTFFFLHSLYFYLPFFRWDPWTYAALICGANQWTGFYMITASIMKGLNMRKVWSLSSYKSGFSFFYVFSLVEREACL